MPMLRGWIAVAPLLAAAGLILACLDQKVRSEVVFPPGGTALDSTGSRPRVYAADSLHLVVQVGGRSDQDTTLLNPYIMAADDGGVYLFESENRILRFDTTGARLWVRGRDGGGPGEYRNPRDMKVGPGGELWLVDPDAGRVTVLETATGKLRRSISMRVPYSPMITPLRHGFVLYPHDPAQHMFYFDEAGAVVRADTIPWAGFRELDFLPKGLRTAVDPKTGIWVLGFIYGNGWFAFDTNGQGTARRYYVEPTRFPPVIREQYPDGAIGTKLVRTVGSSLDLDLRGDTVFVLFDGEAPDRRRKLDMYSWKTGNYLGSLRLPEPVDDVGLCGRYLATYSSRPVPRLSFYLRDKTTAARPN